MDEDRSNGAKSRPIVADGVGGVLADWLSDGLEGSDAVRGAVAKRLARELDDPALPPYVVAKLASTLVAVVAAIDAKREIIQPGMKPSRAQLSRLLDLVNDA